MAVWILCGKLRPCHRTCGVMMLLKEKPSYFFQALSSQLSTVRLQRASRMYMKTTPLLIGLNLFVRLFRYIFHTHTTATRWLIFISISIACLHHHHHVVQFTQNTEKQRRKTNFLLMLQCPWPSSALDNLSRFILHAAIKKIGNCVSQ